MKMLSEWQVISKITRVKERFHNAHELTAATPELEIRQDEANVKVRMLVGALGNEG